MFNAQRPTLDELPSSAQLLRSTALAAGVAAALLVTVVLPAEYALDPTGAGRLLGLTQMGELKAQLAEDAAAPVEAAPLAAAPVPAVQPPVAPVAKATTAVPLRQHEVNIILEPNQAAEIKLEMKQDAEVRFTWTTHGGVVNYDTHGDPYNAPKGFYHGYGKGRGTPSDEGVLKAAFDGHHGWFWRNRSGERVTVTLRTNGQYAMIQRVL